MQTLTINLDGKHILITGASSGIGKQTAITLAENGAQLVLLARDEPRLQQLREELPGEGHTIYSFDLKQTDDIVPLVKDIAKQHGKLNGIFHSAGLECILPINIIKEAHIDNIFSASFKAGFMLAKAMSLKAVHADGDKSLVFMSSVSAIAGQKGTAVYAASRGAIESVRRSLAVELAPKGIRVNSIVSGAIQTEMHTRITENLNEAGIAEYQNKHLLGFGSPIDIANGALYLLSEASKWITGTSLTIDGGLLCR